VPRWWQDTRGARYAGPGPTRPPPARLARPPPKERHPIDTEERYKLGSLGDLIELLVDGWQIDHLHYADHCGLDTGGGDPPAAFIELTRPDQGRYGIYIPDDGRAFSHRALVSLFRERPHIWKHRTAERIHALAADTPMAAPVEPSEWGDVVEPFPQALVFSPGTLRGVTSIDQTQSIDGVTLAVTSLERYQDGARLRFLAHTADAKKRKQVGAVHDVLAVDQAGGRGRGAGRGTRRDGNRAEGSLALGPAIPRDVTSITVTVGSLGDARLPGPWVFPIQLAPSLT
jgi:hypothetical protein